MIRGEGFVGVGGMVPGFWVLILAIIVRFVAFSLVLMLHLMVYGALLATLLICIKAVFFGG